MKNIFRILMAVAVLFTASCAKEDISSSIAGGEVEVTFTASLPELGTRAYGDGAKANFLQVNVYDAANDQLLPELCREVDATDTRKFTFQLVLLKGMEYDIVLWADVKGNSFYDLEGKDVAVTYGTAANDDNRDAFYAYIDNFDPTSDEPAFTLYRPFAQLNAAVLASDVEAAQKSGVTLTTSALKTKAYTALNLENNAATNEVEVTFTEAAIPTEKWNNADEYKHLSMNYLLVPSAGHVAKVEFTFKGKRADDSVVTFTGTTYDNVPFKQNYRTNILGALLTKPTDFEVKIEAGFAGEKPETLEEKLSLAAQLGGEFTLTEDVVLAEDKSIEVKADFVLNLNGKTITGNIAKSEGPVIKVAEGATLAISNGTVSSTAINGGSAIVNNGTTTIENVTINGAPIVDGGWPSYGINNNGTLTINGATITTYHGAVATGGEGVTVINDATIDVGNSTETNQTSWALYVYENGQLTVNGGSFANTKNEYGQVYGGGYICTSSTKKTIINGGSFDKTEGDNNGTGFYYNCQNLVIKGGTFDANPSAYVAAGYKAVLIDSWYRVLPEVIADAAVAANVTAVTESTADVATALTTDNGKATMFMWNDVAYIAKYGEVIITSAADEATTVRGVVEYAAGLKSATVAEGVEVVGNRTFRKCANLETVALPNTLTEIGPAVFQSCPKLANVTIPASVTTIGEGAFAECTSLTSINIPEGITRLEKDVLRNTGLVSIEIPASVNYIGAYAFRDCESLTSVIINSPDFTIENNSFTNMAAPVPTMTIYVVNSEMKAYLDSVLTNYDKSYITVVGPKSVSTADELKAAIINGDNIELANDITVDQWIMFSETFNIGTGQIITVNMDGLTIDGKGHTLTVNDIESAGNGDLLFDDASNLNIKNLTINYAAGVAGGISLKSGVIRKVNFVGGVYGIYPGAGEILVEDCTFATNGDALYFEQKRDNLTVNHCTFNQPAGKNVILLRGDVKFTNNIVNSGRTVNVVSGSPVVTGNNFNNVRLKVYSAATATIANNTINNLAFEDGKTTHSSTFTNNTLSAEAQAALNAMN